MKLKFKDSHSNTFVKLLRGTIYNMNVGYGLKIFYAVKCVALSITENLGLAIFKRVLIRMLIVLHLHSRLVLLKILGTLGLFIF